MRHFVLVLLLVVLAVAASSYADTASFKRCLMKCKKAASHMHEKPKVRFAGVSVRPVAPSPSRCLDMCRALQKNETSASTLADTESNSGLSADDIWARYRSEILNLITGGDQAATKGVLLVAEELEAQWEDNKAILNQVADRVPEDDHQFYTPTLMSISAQYNYFLKNLNPFRGKTNDKELKSQYDAILAQHDQLSMDMQMAEGQCFDGYTEFKDFLGIDYATYVKQGNCPELTRFELQRSRLDQQLHEMETKMDGAMAEVSKAVTMFNSFSTKDYSDFGALKRFKQNCASGNTKKFSIDINSGTKIRTEYTKTTKKRSLFRSKTHTTTEITFANSKFDMNIKAEGYEVINVFPGKWFNPTIVQKYKADTSSWFKPGENFFGVGGTLKRVPSVFYVIYRPTITLNLSEENGRYFSDHKTSSFSFGPIFNSNKGHKVEVKQNADKSYTVSFLSTTDSAYVIAIRFHEY